jgi:hypothetical protein
MNPQLSLVANRQFWAGVAATVIAGILIATGVPNLLRTRISPYEAKRASYAMHTSLEPGGGGGGDRDELMSVLSFSGSEQDRKMIRTASMGLVVKNPRDTSEKIRLLAEQSAVSWLAPRLTEEKKHPAHLLRFAYL